jgi:hypothetical protein
MHGVTLHYDNARTGWLQRPSRMKEEQRTPRPWGKYADLDLSAPVRGAAVFLSDWTLKQGDHAGETHTILYVATSDNHVYAFSEDQLRSGHQSPIWHTQLGPASWATGSNIPPPVGVCSTMVIDPSEGRLFVVALTVPEGKRDDANNHVYHAYRLDVDTGLIRDDQAIFDHGEAGPPTFTGKDHDQRGALTLESGRLYVTFADFLAGDHGPYHGWLVGLDANDLRQQIFFPVTRSVLGGGIWGPGGASAGDDSLYVVTGNAPSAGDENGPGPVSLLQPDSWWDAHEGSRHPGDYGEFFEAVVRLDVRPTMLPDRWTNAMPVKGDRPPRKNWFGNDNEGSGIAIADINGNGTPDVIVFHIDHPSGGNHGYYRIGWDLDASTGQVTGGWTDVMPVRGGLPPQTDWFGNDNQGGGIAVADINGNGRQDLIVFHIDHSSGGNHGYYRIGWDLDANTGQVTGGWTDAIRVRGDRPPHKDWFGNDNEGGGIAVADLNRNGNLDLIVFHIEHPSGGNHGYYRIGWDLAATAQFVVDDWYLPASAQDLNETDADLGGASALLLPPIDGSSQRTLVTSDKAGNIYLLDRDNLGHWGGETWLGQIYDGDVTNKPHHEVRSAPAYYRTPGGDHYVYLSAHDAPGLVAYKVTQHDGRQGLEEVWRAHDLSTKEVGLVDSAGSPLVVSTAAGDQLEYASVWIVDGPTNPALRAFDALDGKEIFNSMWSPFDALGSVPHYPPMNCTTRSVLVGTDTGLACYKLPWTAPTTVADLVVFHIDHPSGGNHGYHRVGPRVDGPLSPGAVTEPWTGPTLVKGGRPPQANWFGNDNQGGGIAVADINQNGRPDLIVFHIDHPSGGNHGYYRIGWDAGAFGDVAAWTDVMPVRGDRPPHKDWFGNDNQGGGIAVADVNGNGNLDLIVFHIDHPSGGNDGFYRIGWDLDPNTGQVTGGWTDVMPVRGDLPPQGDLPRQKDWFGNDNQGGGIAVADINGTGRQDLIVFHIDHPSGGNHGYYRIGWDLDPNTGQVTGGWTDAIQIGSGPTASFGNENQGGGIAVADLNRNGNLDLIVFHIDHPSGGNHGYYRIGWDLDPKTGKVTGGGWTAPIEVEGWFGNDSQAGSIAVAIRHWTWIWTA